ncbi:DUF4129 domain-containing protein [Microbacterium xanthum]|uniref:DUF4129 domain-containing protein n=1 Tax=Microbacterium xanthum TaxID=3079794 RepID=UPI002AD39D36|nr:DUF4129 domain-containing protein [Microbacterium sp. KSW-48]MDZ8171088.1 DUF4129 domain-containing protein [Microbacterium sp. KSW-48]
MTGAIQDAIVASATSVPPLTPDDDEARRWAENELSDRVYAEAEPTPFDLFARAVTDFLADLFNPEIPAGLESVFALVAVAVVVVLLIVGLVIWGRPRATRRGVDPTAELFGERETRSARTLRAEAEAEAAYGRWDTAVVLRFRALARSLTERGVIEAPPGATVHAFARAAARPFPDAAAELEDAARAFDDVRYLRRPGTADVYARLAHLDDALSSRRPAVLPAVPA